VVPSSTALLAPIFISTFFTSERLIFSPTYLYQKDKRALPGDLHSRKFSFVPSVKCSISHNPTPLSLLSLSVFGFEGLK
jgi:hypothetical protein